MAHEVWQGEPLSCTDRVLFRLREVMPNATGSDAPVEPDRPLVEYLREADALDDIDLVDLFFRWEHEFGFRCQRDEWNALFALPTRDRDRWMVEVAPQLTFRAIAGFIAQRLAAEPPTPPREPAPNGADR